VDLVVAHLMQVVAAVAQGHEDLAELVIEFLLQEEEA
jgi:hypothetical protein